MALCFSLSTFRMPNEFDTLSTSLSSAISSFNISSSSCTVSGIFPLLPPLVLSLADLEIASTAAVGPALCDPFVINDSTSPSSLSIRFCISSGVVGPALGAGFFRVPGAAYEQEEASPRLTQFSHGCERLHLSLRCRHGAHDSGTRFLLRTIRYCSSAGDRPPVLDEFVDGGVGVMIARRRCWSDFRSKSCWCSCLYSRQGSRVLGSAADLCHRWLCRLPLYSTGPAAPACGRIWSDSVTRPARYVLLTCRRVVECRWKV